MPEASGRRIMRAAARPRPRQSIHQMNLGCLACVALAISFDRMSSKTGSHPARLGESCTLSASRRIWWEMRVWATFTDVDRSVVTHQKPRQGIDEAAVKGWAVASTTGDRKDCTSTAVPSRRLAILIVSARPPNPKLMAFPLLQFAQDFTSAHLQFGIVLFRIRHR